VLVEEQKNKPLGFLQDLFLFKVNYIIFTITIVPIITINGNKNRIEQPMAAPAFLCRPDFVQGIPVAFDTLLLALVIPKNLFQLNPPLFMISLLPFVSLIYIGSTNFILVRSIVQNNKLLIDLVS